MYASAFLKLFIAAMVIAIAAAEWTISNSNTNSWYGIRNTHDGRHVHAVAMDDKIYSSNDAGHTWFSSSHATGAGFVSVTTTADGSVALAADANGKIWSSNNNGQSWTATNSGCSDWVWLSISEDGANAYAVSNTGNGFVAKSIDHGVTWTTVYAPATALSFSGISTSADGQYVYATTMGYIYKSNDFGATWTQTAQAISTSSTAWYISSNSDDGKYVFAGQYPGQLARSTDYGVTWEVVNHANNYWSDITNSGDGKVVYAVAGQGSGAENVGVYQSLNHGTVWHSYEHGLASDSNWGTVSTSEDGKTSFVAVSGGMIFRHSEKHNLRQ